MKRSDMVNKMCILIESFDNPYIEEAMEAILKMQQENGMLPPERRFGDVMTGEYVCRWEEDDPPLEEIYDQEALDYLHQLEMETRHVKCDCKLCKRGTSND